MAATYFVRIAGQQHGPFATAGLRKLAATGHLARDDFVSRDGQKWVSAARVKGLSFPSAPPPKPVPSVATADSATATPRTKVATISPELFRVLISVFVFLAAIITLVVRVGRPGLRSILTPLYFVAIGALFAAGLFYYRLLLKRDTEGLQAVSEEFGMRLYPNGGDVALHRAVSRFEFRSLMSLRADLRDEDIKNLLIKRTDEYEFAVFEFWGVEGTGETSSHVCHTVFYYCSDRIRFPWFRLTPKFRSLIPMGKFTLWSMRKLRRTVGDVIEFRSRRKFSKKYLLFADDEAAVRKVFCDQVLDFFEQQKGSSRGVSRQNVLASGACVEGRGSKLVYYRPGVRVSPRRIRSFIEEGFQIAKLFQS